MKKSEIITYFIIVKYNSGSYGVERMSGTVSYLGTLMIGQFDNYADAKALAEKARDEYIAKCEKSGCFREGENPKETIKLSYTVWGSSFFDDIVDNVPKLEKINATNINK